MATATLRYGATRKRDYTPSGADKVAGDVVILDDNRVGIVVAAVADGELGAVYIDGVFAIASASATEITIGHAVYLDVSDSNNVIPTGSKAAGDILLGTALAAKAADELTALVDLNARVGTVHA